MRGRVICTSSKMRKRMAFRLQDEAKQLKGLFKDLVSLYLCQAMSKRNTENTPNQMENPISKNFLEVLDSGALFSAFILYCLELF